MAFLDMLGAFTEFDTNLRRERQAEGIAKAKVAGVKTRARTVDAEAVRRLVGEGAGALAIARHKGIGRASVYQVLKGIP